MCGIFGYSRRTAVTEAMAPYLAWEMEERGSQSWGMTNGTKIIKHASSIIDSWEWPTIEEWGDGPLIVHTRQASRGAITEENAHPFSSTMGIKTIPSIMLWASTTDASPTMKL